MAIPSHLFCYKSLDRMAAYDKAGLVYPIAVGTCVFSFAIYSVFLLQEERTSWHVWGIVVGGLGILFLVGS
jgi:drug/metabolite transporter (DMT)-like permease